MGLNDGIIFTDARGKRYMVRRWDDEIWLFYWHSFAGYWVSLRRLDDE